MNGAGPPDTIYCQQCGQELRADAQFCDRCGANQQSNPEHGQQPGQQPTQSPSQTTPAQPSPDEDPVVSRRGVIAAGGLVSAGVIGGGAYWLTRDTEPTFELAADPWLESDVVDDDFRSRMTGRLELEQGEYATRDMDFEFDRTVEVRVTVDKGAVDVGLFPKEEFQRYRDQEEDPRSITALSQSAVTDEFHSTADVLDGEYTLVFDNTGAFGSDPDGLVTTDVMLEGRLVSKEWFEFRDNIESFDGIGRIDVSSDRAQWYVLYQADGLSDDKIATELQDILIDYTAHIPDSNDHTGLLLEYRGESLFEYEVPKELARQYAQGEISEEEYYNTISEENS